MISLLRLNKLIISVIFFTVFNFNLSLADDEPADIWEQEENKNHQENQTTNQKDTKIESPILNEGENKSLIKIDENEIKETKESVVGIFDPEKNNFNLNMWSTSNGEDIIKVLEKIKNLKLSKESEELLFQVLFTNAYPPKTNLNSKEFLDIKINWLIDKKRIKDLETLLKINPEASQNLKAIKYLINEYLSSSDIKSACDKISFIDRKVNNNYLEKFTIYCLVNNGNKDEAQLIFDLLEERGFKDKFFEDKINFLLGINEKTNQTILDNDLLNFHLSYITSNNFEYEPNEKTNKYIWRYLSSANLIQVNDIENEDIILTYEQAAAQDSFQSDEIFKIYLKINFNFNQLVNAEEVYKNLPNYKARALIYQSTKLNDNVEKKIYLALLLKELFIKDNLLNIYDEELSDILESIDPQTIPEDYAELVKKNLSNRSAKSIKFDNAILHRSKIIKHFLQDNEKISATEKDFKSVYKKIKRNKKYFISIKDIVVLESLLADGVTLPKDLKYQELLSELTVPKNLEDLANQNQIGLVMLKIIEIIGEDSIKDLDSETLYFLSKILNDLNLKKIRNKILSEALPVKI